MITLERLIDLGADKALERKLMKCMTHAMDLVACDAKETIDGIVQKAPGGVDEAVKASRAMTLVIYEETRKPYIEFLRELDERLELSRIPHLHQRLKELLK